METLQFSIDETLEGAVREVFSTMAATELARIKEDATTKMLPPAGGLFIGTVPFAGRASGVVHLFLPDTLAINVSTAILGLSSDEVGETDVCDVISELSNMVGGRVKSVLSDSGISCELSLPTVMKGQDIKIKTELQGGSRYLMAFQNQENVMLVELALKLQPK